MKIPSGVTDQYVYFVAVDSIDYVTRETGLSSFTVYRSRNGGASAAMTTPTINETDSTNMPGVYELLLDEDMTLDSGDQSQAMVFHITATGMAPVTLQIELYRPTVTTGQTITVASGVAEANAVQISDDATSADNLETACTNYSATRGLSGTALPAVAADGAGGLPISDAGGLDLDTMNSNVSAILTDTGALRVKKNTALANFPFPMLNTSGAPTASLTVTAERSIDGAAFASCANSVSEVSDGWYKISLAAADLNGDTIALRFAATGANDTCFTLITQNV